jgi:hypothetical protein
MAQPVLGGPGVNFIAGRQGGECNALLGSAAPSSV